MIGPIFTQEREWIDVHYWNFDSLPEKQQIEIVRRARREVARENFIKQQNLVNAKPPRPRRPYWV